MRPTNKSIDQKIKAAGLAAASQQSLVLHAGGPGSGRHKENVEGIIGPYGYKQTSSFGRNVVYEHPSGHRLRVTYSPSNLTEGWRHDSSTGDVGVGNNVGALSRHLEKTIVRPYKEKERLTAKEDSTEREGICPQCNKPIQQCKCNQTEVEVEAGQEEELGTKDSGFSAGGPFSCMDCTHRTPHSYDKDKKIVDSCKHPKVVNDKELESRKLPDNTIQVNKDDCCRYVRPESKK